MKNPKFPQDKFNQELINTVFPSNWKNPKAASSYDLVVIGGGPGGMTAAVLASHYPKKVALIEKAHMGGECLNVGCIPSKALLHSSRVVDIVRNAKEMGVDVPSGWSVNFSKVMERVRDLRSKISHYDALNNFQKLGIDVFLGNAQFTGPETLEVHGQKLKFKKAILATGTQPLVLPISGLEESGFLTNQTVFNLTSLPKRFAVIGAGPLGCELAQAFTRFGSQVTMITHGPRILSREDDTAAELLKKIMEKEGVQFLFNTNVKKVETKGSDKVLFFENGKALKVDEILMAVGRTPSVLGCGLEKANVVADAKQGIAVNDFLQTSNPNIYSISDMEYKLTHASMANAEIAVKNALGDGKTKKSSLVMPWCTYTDPEIAQVGITEKEAAKKGMAIETIFIDMAGVPRAMLDSETKGLLKIHVKVGTDQIVGATFMGSHAGEMISEITVAITSGGGLSSIIKAIHPFPTQSEVFKMASEMLQAKMAKNGRKSA